MQLWGLVRMPDTLTWTRNGLTLSLTEDRPARQHCLREAWRAATWDDWRHRALRREAHLARATQALWQPA
eukprot:556258-Alexandrium_andersonii.AAC.1